jgi:hypothetical protein
MSPSTSSRRPRLTKQVRDRLRRLLDMEYRPSEIADVLEVHKDTVLRGWVQAGLPHRRDDSGAVWINGVVLAAWLRQLIRKSRVKLGPAEAYCLRCGRAVTVSPPIVRERVQHAVLVRGTCAQCSGAVDRFVSEDDA